MTTAAFTLPTPTLATPRSMRRKSLLRSVVPQVPALFHAWRP